MADKTVARWFGGPVPSEKFEQYKQFQTEHGYKSQSELVVAAIDALMAASPPPAPPQVEREEDMGVSTPVKPGKKKTIK